MECTQLNDSLLQTWNQKHFADVLTEYFSCHRSELQSIQSKREPVFWFQDGNRKSLEQVEKPQKVCVTSKVKHLTSDPSRGFVWEVTFCQQRWTSWNHPYTNTFHSCQWRKLLLQRFLVAGDVEPSIYTCMVVAIVYTCTQLRSQQTPSFCKYLVASCIQVRRGKSWEICNDVRGPGRCQRKKLVRCCVMYVCPSARVSKNSKTLFVAKTSASIRGSSLPLFCLSRHHIIPRMHKNERRE